ncbi:hypothetical protein ACH5RR_001189 [Cinchona calisaya]|uniref:Beta-glucosidase n=1 Tax=Cinchona calisaya TaxID=153742 RepID=A0ABD3B3C2_9GENT
MEIHRSDFHTDFIFGAGTAAYQIEGAVAEGGRGPSSWDTLIQRTPGKVNEGQNANIACNSYYLYKEDVKLAKHIGLDSYRFSISWTRVLPGGSLNAGVNKEGIRYYNDLINELLANGIEPFVTLHHFEVPQPLEEEYGGFLSDRIVKDFCEFAELCFWEFGDRVKHWTTFNEPWSFIYYGYVAGSMPPCRGSSSAEHAEHPLIRHRCHHHCAFICEKGDPGVEPYMASRHLLLAHAEAVQIYRKKFKVQGGKIGLTLVTHWYEPLTQSESDVEAAQRAMDFEFGWFMDPVTYGQYPLSMIELVPPNRLQRFSPEESDKLKGSYDFLGLNYYTSLYATDYSRRNYGPPSYITDSQTKTQCMAADGKTLIGPETDCGWIYICPKGIYKLLCYIKKQYNDPPIYITENGVAESEDFNKTVCEARADETRINYHREHLKEIKHAMVENRVNVKGYFIWSLIDNFEWTSGYKVRFGLVYVYFKDDQLSRYPKDSALWFMNFLDKKNKPVEYPPRGGLLANHAMEITTIPPPSFQKLATNSVEIVVRESPIKRLRAN